MTFSNTKRSTKIVSLVLLFSFTFTSTIAYSDVPFVLQSPQAKLNASHARTLSASYENGPSRLARLLNLVSLLKDEETVSQAPHRPEFRQRKHLVVPQHFRNMEVDKLLAFLGFDLFDPQGEFPGRVRYQNDYRAPELKIDLWYVPHALTFGNEQNIFQGASENELAHLSPMGRVDAEEGAKQLWQALGDRLKKGEKIVFLTSPSERAKESAAVFEALAKRHGVEIQVITDPRAIEMDFGDWEGHRFNRIAQDVSPEEGEKRRQIADGRDALARPRNGENFLAFFARVRDGIRYYNQQYSGKTVVVFGHMAWARSLTVILDPPSLPDLTFIDWIERLDLSARGKPIHFPAQPARRPEFRKTSIYKDFKHQKDLGIDSPIALILKSVAMDPTAIVRWNTRRTAAGTAGQHGVYQQLRGKAEQGLVTTLRLNEKFSLDPAAWKFEALEPRGFAMNEDEVIIGSVDRLSILKRSSGEVIREIRNPMFRNIHTIEFSPDDPRHVLITSMGFDRIFEVDLDSEKILWEWNPWKHGYEKNLLGLTLVAKGDEIPDSHGKRIKYLNYAEAQAAMTSSAQVPDDELWVFVVDPVEITHVLGLEKWQKGAEPNWAAYGKNPDKIIATLFLTGHLIEIDKQTGNARLLLEGLDKPHGAIPYKDGYLVSDTEHGQVLFLDSNFQVVESYDFSDFPDDQGSGFKFEWIQYTAPIGDGSFLASIDARRQKVIVWNPEQKIYSAYPYNPLWFPQAVLALPSDTRAELRSSAETATFASEDLKLLGDAIDDALLLTAASGTYIPGIKRLKNEANRGSKEIQAKLDDARKHLNLATDDSAIKERVEAVFNHFLRHPKIGELTELQVEGIAHALVQKISSNYHVYDALKRQLDEGIQQIYSQIRDEVFKIEDKSKRLNAALRYAGLANILDVGHEEKLKQVAQDLGLTLDLQNGMTPEDLAQLTHGIYQKIEKEGLLVDHGDFDQFSKFIDSHMHTPAEKLIYFVDNHGEIIFDFIVIEELLKRGYNVTVVARAKGVRDDVTVDEAKVLVEQNPHLVPYYQTNQLQVITDGSELMGADLSRMSRSRKFGEEWSRSTGFIAKGSGNWSTLITAKHDSKPGFFVRMMKSSARSYAQLSTLKRRKISQRSPYDLAFVFKPEPTHHLRARSFTVDKDDLTLEELESILVSDRDIEFSEASPYRVQEINLEEAIQGARHTTPYTWRNNYGYRTVRVLMIMALKQMVQDGNYPPEMVSRLATLINHHLTPLIEITEHGLASPEGRFDPVHVLFNHLQGEGRVVYEKRSFAVTELFERLDLSPHETKFRGSVNFSAALSIGNLLRMSDLLDTAEVSAALSREALLTFSIPFSAQVHNTRPHPGQIESAMYGRQLVQGSRLVDSRPKNEGQDAYSLRGIPQIHGAAREIWDHAREMLEVELAKLIRGEPINSTSLALSQDELAIAMYLIAYVSERRLFRLNDPELSHHIAEYLTQHGGRDSGYMIPQYTAAQQVALLAKMAMPQSFHLNDSSASSHAWYNQEAIRKLERVLAIEILMAAQGIDLRLFNQDPKVRAKAVQDSLGKKTGRAYTMLRDVVPMLEDDREQTPDIEKAVGLIRGGAFSQLVRDLRPTFLPVHVQALPLTTFSKLIPDSVVLDGKTLTPEDVWAIAYRPKIPVQIDESAEAQVNAMRKVVEEIARKGAGYGITSGVASFWKKKLSPGELDLFQKHLLLSHSAGVGVFIPQPVARAMLGIRSNTFIPGHSGVRMSLIRFMAQMLDKNIIPAVPSEGSVGASGDLAPLAALGNAVQAGPNAKVHYQGNIVPAIDAFRAAGIEPFQVSFKEGLSLINGTTFSTAFASIGVVEMKEALKQLRTQTLTLRQASVLDSVEGTLTKLREMVTVELNSTTDNPLIIGNQIYQAGNFHGAPMAVVLDVMNIAWATLGELSAELITPNDYGNLIRHDLNALHALAQPGSVHNIPTANNQEDGVSMSSIGAIHSYKATQIVKQLLSFLPFARPEIRNSTQAQDSADISVHWRKSTWVMIAATAVVAAASALVYFNSDTSKQLPSEVPSSTLRPELRTIAAAQRFAPKELPIFYEKETRTGWPLLLRSKQAATFLPIPGVPFGSIVRDANILTQFVKRTPLVSASAMSRKLGMNVLIKDEGQQVTGSFKPRILAQFFGHLLNPVSRLVFGLRYDVITTGTTGNQGQAVAWAVQLLNQRFPKTLGKLTARIFTAVDTPANKRQKMLGFGADVIETDGSYEMARGMAQQEGKKPKTLYMTHSGQLSVSSYGSLGLEIVRDLIDNWKKTNLVSPDFNFDEFLNLKKQDEDGKLTGRNRARLIQFNHELQALDHAAAIVPIGAGGVASGVFAALKYINPKIIVIGAASDMTYSMYLSLLSGASRKIQPFQHVSEDGINVDEPEEFAVEVFNALADAVVVVPHDQIPAAIKGHFDEAGLKNEGASVLPYASLAVYPELVEYLKERGVKHIALVATGQNINEDEWKAALQGKIGSSERDRWLQAIYDGPYTGKMKQMRPVYEAVEKLGITGFASNDAIFRQKMEERLSYILRHDHADPALRLFAAESLRAIGIDPFARFPQLAPHLSKQVWEWIRESLGILPEDSNGSAQYLRVAIDKSRQLVKMHDQNELFEKESQLVERMHSVTWLALTVSPSVLPVLYLTEQDKKTLNELETRGLLEYDPQDFTVNLKWHIKGGYLHSKIQLMYLAELGVRPEIRLPEVRAEFRTRPFDMQGGRLATPNDPVLDQIAKRALWLSTEMIAEANRTKHETKVGGHQAAASSSLHILLALYLFAKRGYDHVAVKPHASPVLHTIQYLLGRVKREQLSMLRETSPELVSVDSRIDQALGQIAGKLPSDEIAVLKNAIASMLPTANSTKGALHGFQSYPSMHDPNVTVPTGSVGLGPATTIFLAIVQKMLKAQGVDVPDSHYFAIVGDAESDEENYAGALVEAARYQVGNVTHIVDMNRQSLDGDRSDFDLDILKKRYEASGWKVIELKWGRKIKDAFESTAHGEIFRRIMDALSQEEYQKLTALKVQKIQNYLKDKLISEAEKWQLDQFFSAYNENQFYELFTDLGGHDLAELTEALETARKSKDVPVAMIAHTIKGWGLRPLIGNPKNHSGLLDKNELETLRKALEIGEDRYPDFKTGTIEGKQLAEIAKRIELEEKIQQDKIKANKAHFAFGFDPASFPERIQSQLLTRIVSGTFRGNLSTQVVMAQLISELAALAKKKTEDITNAEELDLKPVAEALVGTSADVGTSTVLSNLMNQNVFGVPSTNWHETFKVSQQARNIPDLTPRSDGRYFRFSIKEFTAVNMAGALGMARFFFGVPLVPIIALYEFFVFRRALDAFFYSQYWGSRFFMMATPSGSTLSSEGAQHQSLSDPVIAKDMPNTIIWEPAYPQELEYIFMDALKRTLTQDDEGRRVNYFRLSTLPIDVAQLSNRLKQQKFYRAVIEKNADQPEAALRQVWSKNVLRGGYRLVDYRGFKKGDSVTFDNGEVIEIQNDYDPRENVVNLVAAGVMAQEALKASDRLLKEKGIFANVIAVSSPSLLIGNLGKETKDSELLARLSKDEPSTNFAQLRLLIPIEERDFVPIVSVADASASYLSGIGDILGITSGMETLGLRQNGISTRDVHDNYAYHGISAADIFLKAWALLYKRDLDSGSPARAFNTIDHRPDSLADLIRHMEEKSARHELREAHTGDFLLTGGELNGAWATPEDFAHDKDMAAAAGGIRDFYEKVIKPHANEIDRGLKRIEDVRVNSSSEDKRDQEVDLFERAGEDGLFKLSVPEKFGGYALPVILKSLADRFGWYVSPGVALSFGVHSGVALYPILKYGTKEQIERVALKIMSGEWKAAYALTTAENGSDSLSAKIPLSSRAVLEPGGKHYRLNGANVFITNAGFADVYVAFAMIGDKKSAFIVERSRNGVSVGQEYQKAGLLGSSTREVIFDHVLVPVENLLGEPGDGRKIGMSTMNSGRLSIAASVWGGGERVRDDSLAYAKLRKQGGKFLIQIGHPQEMVAEMAAYTYAQGALIHAVSALFDSGVEDPVVEAAIAKVWNTEIFKMLSAKGVQLHGGAGVMMETPVARLDPDAVIARIFEGTNPALDSNAIAAETLKYLREHVWPKRGRVLNDWKPAVLEWKPAGDIPEGSPLHEQMVRLRVSTALIHEAAYLIDRYAQVLNDRYPDGTHAMSETPESQSDFMKFGEMVAELHALLAVFNRTQHRVLDLHLESSHETDLTRVVLLEGVTRIRTLAGSLLAPSILGLPVDLTELVPLKQKIARHLAPEIFEQRAELRIIEAAQVMQGFLAAGLLASAFGGFYLLSVLVRGDQTAERLMIRLIPAHRLIPTRKLKQAGRYIVRTAIMQYWKNIFSSLTHLEEHYQSIPEIIEEKMASVVSFVKRMDAEAARRGLKSEDLDWPYIHLAVLADQASQGEYTLSFVQTDRRDRNDLNFYSSLPLYSPQIVRSEFRLEGISKENQKIAETFATVLAKVKILDNAEVLYQFFKMVANLGDIEASKRYVMDDQEEIWAAAFNNVPAVESYKAKHGGKGPIRYGSSWTIAFRKLWLEFEEDSQLLAAYLQLIFSKRIAAVPVKERIAVLAQELTHGKIYEFQELYDWLTKTKKISISANALLPILDEWTGGRTGKVKTDSPFIFVKKPPQKLWIFTIKSEIFGYMLKPKQVQPEDVVVLMGPAQSSQTQAAAPAQSVSPAIGSRAPGAGQKKARPELRSIRTGSTTAPTSGRLDQIAELSPNPTGLGAAPLAAPAALRSELPSFRSEMRTAWVTDPIDRRSELREAVVTALELMADGRKAGWVLSDVKFEAEILIEELLGPQSQRVSARASYLKGLHSIEQSSSQLKTAMLLSDPQIVLEQTQADQPMKFRFTGVLKRKRGEPTNRTDLARGTFTLDSSAEPAKPAVDPRAEFRTAEKMVTVRGGKQVPEKDFRKMQMWWEILDDLNEMAPDLLSFFAGLILDPSSWQTERKKGDGDKAESEMVERPEVERLEDYQLLHLSGENYANFQLITVERAAAPKDAKKAADAGAAAKPADAKAAAGPDEAVKPAETKVTVNQSKTLRSVLQFSFRKKENSEEGFEVLPLVDATPGQGNSPAKPDTGPVMGSQDSGNLHEGKAAFNVAVNQLAKQGEIEIRGAQHIKDIVIGLLRAGFDAQDGKVRGTQIAKGELKVYLTVTLKVRKDKNSSTYNKLEVSRHQVTADDIVKHNPTLFQYLAEIYTGKTAGRPFADVVELFQLVERDIRFSIEDDSRVPVLDSAVTHTLDTGAQPKAREETGKKLVERIDATFRRTFEGITKTTFQKEEFLQDLSSSIQAAENLDKILAAADLPAPLWAAIVGHLASKASDLSKIIAGAKFRVKDANDFTQAVSVQFAEIVKLYRTFTEAAAAAKPAAGGIGSGPKVIASASAGRGEGAQKAFRDQHGATIAELNKQIIEKSKALKELVESRAEQRLASRAEFRRAGFREARQELLRVITDEREATDLEILEALKRYHESKSFNRNELQKNKFGSGFHSTRDQLDFSQLKASAALDQGKFRRSEILFQQVASSAKVTAAARQELRKLLRVNSEADEKSAPTSILITRTIFEKYSPVLRALRESIRSEFRVAVLVGSQEEKAWFERTVNAGVRPELRIRALTVLDAAALNYLHYDGKLKTRVLALYDSSEDRLTREWLDRGVITDRQEIRNPHQILDLFGVLESAAAAVRNELRVAVSA